MEQIERTVSFYTESLKNPKALVEDEKRIKWTRGLRASATARKAISTDRKNVASAAYRPFCKLKLYYDRDLNEMFVTRIYPSASFSNLVISASGKGATKDFSAVITDEIPDLEVISKGQCFPLYLYEKAEAKDCELDLGGADDGGEIIDGYRRKSAITDSILKEFRKTYGKGVSKEDIFYYVYGILHSPEYRERFAADLKKMLPRIPLTQDTKDFKAFIQAGRDLAHWHLHYETINPHPAVKEETQDLGLDPWELYQVRKMTFARPTAAQKAAGEKWDKTRIIYNSKVTLTGIPLEAYDYVVNGKPALEWIMERYQVTVDKKSGIKNDPNDWCREHDNPRYIIDLLRRVTRVSVETNKIVNALPALNEHK